jgi:hypothetical protein
MLFTRQSGCRSERGHLIEVEAGNGDILREVTQIDVEAGNGDILREVTQIDAEKRPPTGALVPN